MPFVCNGDRERFAVVARWYTESTSVTHSPSESELSSSDEEEEDLGSGFFSHGVHEATASVKGLRRWVSRGPGGQVNPLNLLTSGAPQADELVLSASSGRYTGRALLQLECRRSDVVSIHSSHRALKPW